MFLQKKAQQRDSIVMSASAESAEEKKTYDRSTVKLYEKRQHEGSDGRKFCCYGGSVCTQRPMKGYDFCVKHILQDPHAPFKQCDYVVTKNTGKLCGNPVKITDNDDPRYCNAHKQMLGLMPKGSGQYSKKKKQQAKAAAASKKKDGDKTSTSSEHTAQVHLDDSSGTETDDEFKTEGDRPKRTKKRRYQSSNKKARRTFHEQFFDNVDSGTDSDVPTEDEFEEQQKQQEDESLIEAHHFSSLRHHPGYARSHMIQLAQAGITQPLSAADYFEKHLITKEEYLQMRKNRIEQLLNIYQRQHSRLKRALKDKYRNFILQKEQMVNSVTDGDAKLSVRLKNVGSLYAPPAKPIFEFPDETSQIYVCEKTEKTNADGVQLCSYAQCSSRRMLASDFCFQHILYDNNQRLYKTGSGGVTDPVLCAVPTTTLKKEAEQRKTIAVIAPDNISDLKPVFANNEEQTRLLEMIDRHQKNTQAAEVASINNTMVL
jgi:hypothetical protein